MSLLLGLLLLLLILILLLLVILRLNIILLLLILLFLIVIVLLLVSINIHLFLHLHIDWELDELRVLLCCVLQLVLSKILMSIFFEVQSHPSTTPESVSTRVIHNSE